MNLSRRTGRRIAFFLVGMMLAGAMLLPAGRAAADGAGPHRATIPTNNPQVFAFEAPPANFDPTTASPAELQRYGFPVPPDAATHPKQYQEWADDVRHAKHEVVPTFTAHPDIKHPTSSNWSGAVARSHASSCSSCICILGDFPTEVVGAWTVPSVGNSTQTSYSSTWVGLDGSGNNQVEQMGTEQDATQSCVFACWINTVYYPWFELFPDGEQAISNFPIGPGDRMYADVQCDAYHNVVNFYLHDYTRGEYAAFSTPAKYGCGGSAPSGSPSVRRSTAAFRHWPTSDTPRSPVRTSIRYLMAGNRPSPPTSDPSPSTW